MEIEKNIWKEQVSMVTFIVGVINNKAEVNYS